MNIVISNVVRLACAAVLASMLAACSSENRNPNSAVQNGAIVDDLRAPSSRNY